LELPAITDPLGTPDAFWSAMDHAFTRARGQTRRTPGRRLQRRTAEFRTNLNYNLIMHRRLVVEDVGLLMSRELAHLLAPESGVPEYRDFLSQGAITPAFREGVTSFSRLAEVMLANRQYQELGPDLLRKTAHDLDAAQPQIAVTTTESNRQLMHSLVESRFLDQDMWSDVGLGEIGSDLVRSVPDATRRNRSEFYRRTEFWEFADRLDKKKKPELAQKIRAQISTLSLGVVATNLNLHSIYPAPFAEYVDRVFGTSSPWTVESSNAELPDTSIVANEVASVQRDVRLLASYLRPADIWQIRGSREYAKFLSDLASADDAVPHQATSLLLGAMREYHGFLQVIVGAGLQDRMSEWRSLETRSRWIRREGKAVAASAGLISNMATAYSSLPATEGLALSMIPVGAMNVCLYLLGRHVRSAREKFDLQARSALSAVTRPSGSVAIELYGPVDIQDWGSSGAETGR
jgi:hypothetical protein